VVHRARCPGIAGRQRPFEHPWQPHESRCSIRFGTCPWPLGRFLSSARAVRVHLGTGAAGANRLDLDAQDPLPLELLEHPIEHAVLRPSIHPRMDRVPVAELCRQTAPLAAVLGHMEDRVEYLRLAMLTFPRCLGSSGAICSYGACVSSIRLISLDFSLGTMDWKD